MQVLIVVSELQRSMVHFLVRIACEFGSIFGKVLVAIGIIDCIPRSFNRQIATSALTICIIVRIAGGHEMAHLVNDRTLLCTRIGQKT